MQLETLSDWIAFFASEDKIHDAAEWTVLAHSYDDHDSTLMFEKYSHRTPSPETPSKSSNLSLLMTVLKIRFFPIFYFWQTMILACAKLLMAWNISLYAKREPRWSVSCMGHGLR